MVTTTTKEIKQLEKDYDEFIKVPKYLLLISGFWPFKITNNDFYVGAYKIYSLFQKLAYGYFVLSLFIELVILMIKNDQPTRMYGSINVLIMCTETYIKIWLFEIKQIPAMYQDVMKYEEKILNSSDREEINFYREQVKYCRKLNLFQFFATMLAGVSFTIATLVRAAFSENESEFKDQPYMFDIWFPFEKVNHMPLVIFWNNLINTQGILFFAFTQATFISLMIFASTRLRILQLRLRKFDVIAMEMNKDVVYTVKELIVEHQFLISFVKTLNERTSYVMLLEFLLNSISIASVSVQFVKVTSADLLAVGSLLFLVVSQIFVLGWSANEIQEQSLGVAAAVAESKWDTQSEEVKKLLLFMTMRAQTPLALSAGPFFQMSAETAVSTMKVAYSYVSLMMQNYQE